MPEKEQSLRVKNQVIIEAGDLQGLFDLLRNQGYTLVGPAVRENAIVYDELKSTADLPRGWTDEQEGGRYRLKKRGDDAWFGYAVGPQSWKKFLNPSLMRLWQARRNARGFQIIPEKESRPKFAFLGVRSCELHALAIQDKVFKNGGFVDTVYQLRRENALMIAVQCGQAGGTCFCVSMKTGPKTTFGFDIALTEMLTDNRHFFVAEAGTDLGVQILSQVPHKEAGEEEKKGAEDVVEKTALQMGRVMDTTGIKELLYRNYENPRWDNVAARCLTCANCTMVCPTCFCSTVEDVTDLKGENAERWRKWDSCFTMNFSYIHGGNVRASTQSRYRQWITHKLAAWFDQFGTSGCVGCGRCITWCPVAIDITEEVRAIRESESVRDTNQV